MEFLVDIDTLKEYSYIQSNVNTETLTITLKRVQDRYSFRCVPQVHEPTYEAWQKYKSTVECEINATTDNPLFDFDAIDKRTGGVIFASGGNFHDQSLATVIDYMKIALTSLGLMSDKRTFSLMDG